MENKLNKILEDITEIKVTMAEIKSDLGYHIRRTDALEKTITDDFKPIKQHVDRVMFLIQGILYVAGLSGLGALWQWLK